VRGKERRGKGIFSQIPLPPLILHFSRFTSPVAFCYSVNVPTVARGPFKEETCLWRKSYGLREELKSSEDFPSRAAVEDKVL